MDGIELLLNDFAERRAALRKVIGGNEKFGRRINEALDGIEEAHRIMNRAEGAVAAAQEQVRTGAIHRDQLPVIQQRIAAEAERDATARLKAAQDALDAIPASVERVVFPRVAPRNSATMDAKADLALLFGQVKDAQLFEKWAEHYERSLADGDFATVHAMDSQWGEAFLRSHAGDTTDKVMPALRRAAAEAQVRHNSGEYRSNAKVYLGANDAIEAGVVAGQALKMRLEHLTGAGPVMNPAEARVS